MRHLFIAVPSHTGQIWIPVVQSLLRSLPSLLEAGVRVSFDSVFFDYTESARGKLVTRFLSSDATDLLFIDYDNFWHEPGAILRLLNHPVEVVGGDYPRKRFPINYLSRLRDGDTSRDGNGLVEVEGVPAGFLRISRSAIEAMAEVYQPNADGEYEFFYRLKYEGHSLGDDYSFCQRWRDMGGKVYLDPDIRVGHIGTMIYDADIHEWLKAHDAASGNG